MEYIQKRLKTVLTKQSTYQQLGALIMLLSSIAFFVIINFPTHIQFLRHLPIAVTVTGFFIGALLAHGIQKTPSGFLVTVGANLYVVGWAYIVSGLLGSNTYIEVYFKSTVGVYIVFLGVTIYFLHKENPTLLVIGNHIFMGSVLMIAGTMVIVQWYFEFKINLFNVVRIGRLPAIWLDRGIMLVLVGVGLMLISLFMFFLRPCLKVEDEFSHQLSTCERAPAKELPRLTANQRSYE